jgi:hypothetical protein
MKNLLLIFFLNGAILYAQPLNGFNINPIADSTIFQAGTFESCHSSTIVETERAILSRLGLQAHMKAPMTLEFGFHILQIRHGRHRLK